MKILILVGSSLLPPYDEFMKVQKETWASRGYPNTETMFYYADEETKQISEDTFSVACDTGYYWSHWRLKQALDFVWDKDWDIIFRCHSSSYVNVKMLARIANRLPKKRLYTGRRVGSEDLPLIEHNGKMVKQLCVSGAGMLLSRDVADILRHNLPNESSMEDDVLVGRLLQTFGIGINNLGIDRVDIETMEDYELNFHYRFRTGDRAQDMQNMRLVHEKHLLL